MRKDNNDQNSNNQGNSSSLNILKTLFPDVTVLGASINDAVLGQNPAQSAPVQQPSLPTEQTGEIVNEANNNNNNNTNSGLRYRGNKK